LARGGGVFAESFHQYEDPAEGIQLTRAPTCAAFPDRSGGAPESTRAA
jgi:hypothetical protein